jgi:hypothetical protein
MPQPASAVPTETKTDQCPECKLYYNPAYLKTHRRRQHAVRINGKGKKHPTKSVRKTQARAKTSVNRRNHKAPETEMLLPLDPDINREIRLWVDPHGGIWLAEKIR